MGQIPGTGPDLKQFKFQVDGRGLRVTVLSGMRCVSSRLVRCYDVPAILSARKRIFSLSELILGLLVSLTESRSS